MTINDIIKLSEDEIKKMWSRGELDQFCEQREYERCADRVVDNRANTPDELFRIMKKSFEILEQQVLSAYPDVKIIKYSFEPIPEPYEDWNNMGISIRYKYSALESASNVCGRLCEMSRKLREDIATYERIKKEKEKETET